MLIYQRVTSIHLLSSKLAPHRTGQPIADLRRRLQGHLRALGMMKAVRYSNTLPNSLIHNKYVFICVYIYMYLYVYIYISNPETPEL